MYDETQATLERMTAAGVQPDEVTALCLLNAASHAGLGLDVRQLYDQFQIRFPNVKLSASHRTCVVDGFSRAGLFDEAVAEAHDSKCELWRSCLMNIHLATRGLAERSLDVKSDLVGSISSYIVTPPEFLKAAPEWADVQKNIKDALIACVRSALAKAVNTCMQRRFAIPPR
jgi:hypothetical protein